MLTILQWDTNQEWPWFISQLAQQVLDQCAAQTKFKARNSVENQFWGGLHAKVDEPQVRNHLRSALRSPI